MIYLPMCFHAAVFCAELKIMLLYYLPEQDVAVCAKLQGVAVLFFVWVAPAQLKVHFFPFQVSLVGCDEALADL